MYVLCCRLIVQTLVFTHLIYIIWQNVGEEHQHLLKWRQKNHVLISQHKSSLTSEKELIWPTRATYQYSVTKIMNDYLKLKKSEGFQEQVDKFLDSEYTFRIVRSKCAAESEFHPVGKPVPSTPQEEIHRDTAVQSAKELRRKGDDYLKDEHDALKKKRRCQLLLAKCWAKLSVPNRQLKAAETRNKTMTSRIQSKQSELKRKSSRITHLEKKLRKLEGHHQSLTSENDKLLKEVSDLSSNVKRMEKELNDVNEGNHWFREMVNGEIQIKNQDGAYTDMTECVCSLLSQNVPTGTELHRRKMKRAGAGLHRGQNALDMQMSARPRYRAPSEFGQGRASVVKTLRRRICHIRHLAIQLFTCTRP